jgi:hypothetical protein
MLKKLLSISLVSLLVSVSSVNAASREEKQARFAERVKESIVKLGTGPEAQVEVKLRDNTKLKGHIREAGETNFVIVEAKTGNAATVAYPQVKQVKGHNISTGVKIAIGLGVLVVVLVLIALAVKDTIQGFPN